MTVSGGGTAVSPDDAGAVAGEQGPAGATPERRGLAPLLGRYGVLGAFLVTFAVFAILRTSTFLTATNLTDALTQAAPLAVIACGLTIVLVMNDFDLSVGAMAGLGGAVAVLLMSEQGVAWPLAVVIALGVGCLGGLANGLLVAYAGASSFIITLGLGTVMTGAEFLLTGQTTIFENIPEGYVQLGQGEVLGINLQVVVAGVVLLAAYLLLQQTETGRYMHAVGGNALAAHLSGVPVRRLRLIGFVLVAVCAAVAGVLLTAQAASSSPNAGAPLLLTAYAAAFLGSAAFRPGQFNVPGTLLGVLFLAVIQNGLTLMNASNPVINVVQGLILVAAVLLTRLGIRTR